MTEISIHALLAESDAGVPAHCKAFPDFYPRSPCGERLPYAKKFGFCDLISIHALLAESDDILSIHITGFLGFLSTLSLRRATWVWMGGLSCDRNFYPRSPCGERLDTGNSIGGNSYISIHALLAESDGIHYDNYNLHCVISIHALLAESDVSKVLQGFFMSEISIHALLAESDILKSRK